MTAYYLQAQKVRTLIRNDFLKAFVKRMDAIVDADDADRRRSKAGRKAEIRRPVADCICPTSSRFPAISPASVA